LSERRAAVRDEYDADAAAYDAHPYPTASHASFVARLVETCPLDGIVLDAPCGTGKYFEQVREAGRCVVGVDLSGGMLEVARSRGLADRLMNVSLQDMAFENEFDGAMTIDAMEHVPPEDWPSVLANLHRALVPGGHLYLTVEEHDDVDLDKALGDGQARGLPLVRGEVMEGEYGGYHHFPDRDRVAGWLAAQGLTIVDDATDRADGWGYWHLLLARD
jgi:SAM-dependent methyltransferase